jgi:uncharacterized protein
VHTMPLSFRCVTPLALACLGLSACGPEASSTQSAQPTQQKAAMSSPASNPVRYFEIPVTDMERAMAFYAAVFGFDFERETVDGYDMALLPFTDGSPGASGALAKGDVYVPSKTGPILYFDVADIDAVMAKAVTAGAKPLYPKKSIGAAGFVAEFEDSEGNRIALHQR